MSTIAAKNPFEQLKYGATELKEIISRNTVRAFVYTTAALLLLLLINFTYKTVMAMLFPPPNVVKVKLVRVSIDNLAPPPTDADVPPPPPPANMPAAASGPAARAGTPVPVPDALIAPDAKDFANVDEINRASAVGGDGNDMGGFSDGIGVDPNANLQIDTREEVPDVDDFVAVEKEPGFDYEGLQRRVQYPKMAQRNGIEGQVLIAALIGKDGNIKDVKVMESDNTLLNEEAVRAVRGTQFTPGIQNGNPVSVWVRIPIRFRLH